MFLYSDFSVDGNTIHVQIEKLLLKMQHLNTIFLADESWISKNVIDRCTNNKWKIRQYIRKTIDNFQVSKLSVLYQKL